MLAHFVSLGQVARFACAQLWPIGTTELEARAAAAARRRAKCKRENKRRPVSGARLCVANKTLRASGRREKQKEKRECAKVKHKQASERASERTTATNEMKTNELEPPKAGACNSATPPPFFLSFSLARRLSSCARNAATPLPLPRPGNQQS